MLTGTASHRLCIYAFVRAHTQTAPHPHRHMFHGFGLSHVEHSFGKRFGISACVCRLCEFRWLRFRMDCDIVWSDCSEIRKSQYSLEPMYAAYSTSSDAINGKRREKKTQNRIRQTRCVAHAYRLILLVHTCKLCVANCVSDQLNWINILFIWNCSAIA